MDYRLVEQFVTEQAVNGVEPDASDLMIASEWSYHLWRQAGGGGEIEIEIVDDEPPRRGCLSRVFDWFSN